MEDALIIGGLVLLYLVLRQKGTPEADQTIPTATGLQLGNPGDGVIAQSRSVSGGYMLPPPSLKLGTPGVFGGWNLPTVPTPPPPPAPPPPYYGGAAGTTASGGNGLGGSLRAGISVGTGTTVRNPLPSAFAKTLQTPGVVIA